MERVAKGLILRVRHGIEAAQELYAAIWFGAVALIVLCGPGMIVGYQLGDHTGEIVGALVLPVLLGGLWAIRRVMRASGGPDAPPWTDADAAAIEIYAESRRSSTEKKPPG